MKKFSTTKILIAFLFINCTLLEIFTGWVTVENLLLARDFGVAIDFTPLVTLIGIVLGEVAGFAVYSIKSAKENSVGGITYESAMMSFRHNTELLSDNEDEEAMG